MKFIVLVAMCICAAEIKAGTTKEEAMEAFRSVSVACAAETGATDADMDVMMKHLPALNKETKCLRACMMNKFNMITADGKLNKQVVLQMATLRTQGDAETMKIAEEVFDICQNTAVPDDQCEAAEIYKMCLVNGTAKRGIKLTR